MFFEATGDLAYKKIFPAPQAMLKRGHLDTPVIGVAKAAKPADKAGLAQDGYDRSSHPICGLSD